MNKLITLLALLLVNARAFSATSFSFTLDEPCKTSAVVYTNNGPMVRTLWSKLRHYNSGSFSTNWDNKDDSGSTVPSGNYQIRVLEHNTEYVWEGAIGNTSSQSYGNNVHACFYFMHDMAIAGGQAYYNSGYSEGANSFHNFATNTPQFVGTNFGKVGDIYDRTWSFVCSDGTLVYQACIAGLDQASGSAQNTKSGFFVGYKCSDLTTNWFSSGTVETNNFGAGGEFYSNVVHVGTAPSLSGLSVQQSGSILAGAVSGDNKVYFFNKTSGAAASPANFAVTAPGQCSFSPDGSLWVITGTTVIQVTNVTGTPNIAHTISGFANPLAVAVDPANANLIVVADGGSSQQVKAYSTNGTSQWTYGQSGGYPINGPQVTTNKFWFWLEIEDIESSFICFSPVDHSLWVSDPGDHRVIHLDSSRNYLEQIMFQPHSYVSTVDYNNPHRVFNQGLEFWVDYTKPLSNGWTLTNNWAATMSSFYYGIESIYGIREVVTMPGNSHTYGLLWNTNAGTFDPPELIELTSTNLRYTGVFPFPTASNFWVSFDTTGNVYRINKGDANWFKRTLTGFDASNNPTWGAESSIASYSPAASDPAPRCCTQGSVRTSISTNNLIVVWDQSINIQSGTTWHLGAVTNGGSSLLWKAFPSGVMNGAGNFETNGGVIYTGSDVQCVDNQIVAGYPGEFFRGSGQASQHMHFRDDGLFVGQFGETSANSDTQGMRAVPAFMGNSYSPTLVEPIAGEYYLWDNDESSHGPQRWHFVNARNQRVLTGVVSLNSSVTLTAPTVTFPTVITGSQSNNAAVITWNPVTGASTYNVYYSTVNGGPFITPIASTGNTFTTISGLTNGVVYYFAVTSISNGVESQPSEQVLLQPFNPASLVQTAGHTADPYAGFTNVVVSANVSSGIPSYSWTAQLTGNLNQTELANYGLGYLLNGPIGTKGYIIWGYGGANTTNTNFLTGYTVTNSSGFIYQNFLKRVVSIDGTAGADEGIEANHTGTMDIKVPDNDWHYLTLVSPARFNDPRTFSVTLNSGAHTASYSVNETVGQNHTFQWLFQGNVTLTIDETGGSLSTAQALFIDSMNEINVPSIHARIRF